MESALSTTVLFDDAPRRDRAKARLYVLCQSCGWLFLIGLQVVLLITLPQKNPPSVDEQLLNGGLAVMVIALGWLITHFTRPLIAHWGWKSLGWRALLPRIVATSLVQSFVWDVLSYGYPYVVVGLPWTSKLPWRAAFGLNIVQGFFLFGSWLCIYFFYHLFDRLNRSEIERLRLATHVKEAELRALKSQVNPHFIFNSLNSLRALIDEDPARARQAVTQLSNLLRYSLKSGQLETVPFEDELRVVNDYLALEQVRHEERLRLRFDIAPETLTLPVPPMLLQTLVENAVKYGIATRPEGGEIAIIARREFGLLKLQVTNPGALPDAAAASLAPARATPAASTGVGLKNAANRLRLLFGERATLHLRALDPGSVVAEATIPVPLHQT